MNTKFCVDSSSRFPLRAQTDRQTNRQTQLNTIPTPAAIQPAWVNTEVTWMHVKRTRVATLPEALIGWVIRFSIIPACNRQTDKQTDRQYINIALCSRGGRQCVCYHFWRWTTSAVSSGCQCWLEWRGFTYWVLHSLVSNHHWTFSVCVCCLLTNKATDWRSLSFSVL